MSWQAAKRERNSPVLEPASPLHHLPPQQADVNGRAAEAAHPDAAEHSQQLTPATAGPGMRGAVHGARRYDFVPRWRSPILAVARDGEDSARLGAL